MKNSIFITLLLAFVFTGCSTKNLENTSEITGTWDLTNISGGMAGINKDFEEGDVIWTFSSSRVKIENNSEESISYGVPESGTYSYSILMVNGAKIFYLEQQKFGNLNLSSSSLSLDSRAYDGFRIELTKKSK